MKKKTNNSRYKPIDVTVEVEYMPFPSEEKRLEAYRTHVCLWLKAKERMLEKTKTETEALCVISPSGA